MIEPITPDQYDCEHCAMKVHKTMVGWLHVDGFLYCCVKPLSTRATPVGYVPKAEGLPTSEILLGEK